MSYPGKPTGYFLPQNKFEITGNVILTSSFTDKITHPLQINSPHIPFQVKLLLGPNMIRVLELHPSPPLPSHGDVIASPQVFHFWIPVCQI